MLRVHFLLEQEDSILEIKPQNANPNWTLYGTRLIFNPLITV
jgi:hypothetical protein